MESTASAPSIYKAKKQRWITPTMVLVGFIPIFTFALGTWQVQRLKWKVALIDELEEKLQREPMTLPKRINAVPDFAFRKVTLKGHWDVDHAVLLGPRVRNGTNGYHLVVPLELADSCKRHLESGDVEILGMLRTTHKRNAFTPDNHPEKGEWYWADVDAMAEYAGGERAGVQPVLVEEIFEGHAGEISSRLKRGVPVGRAPVVDVRNSHASYVATWYALSAFTSVMFVRLLMKQRQARMRIPR
ncbi:hypothetical protein EVJ58_g7136 [Rhodofomes roseus]|uniref:SURF1-like protein n=1 Tax=Rhodofomes roseus TaxID=34475 RepID=A0A4Y9Y8U7_9APHY|nr:hypothetical protein EVJ58_g7136 [Rhodofomes roseus]